MHSTYLVHEKDTPLKRERIRCIHDHFGDYIHTARATFLMVLLGVLTTRARTWWPAFKVATPLSVSDVATAGRRGRNMSTRGGGTLLDKASMSIPPTMMLCVVMCTSAVMTYQTASRTKMNQIAYT